MSYICCCIYVWDVYSALFVAMYVKLCVVQVTQDLSSTHCYTVHVQ